jgi:hypothetical protein
MRNRKRLALVLAALLLPLTAQAGFSCTGQITWLTVDQNSHIWVGNGGFGPWMVCQLSTPFTAGGITIPVETCKAWYASFLAMKVSGGSVQFLFGPGAATSDNGQSCVDIGSFTVPSPLPGNILFP